MEVFRSRSCRGLIDQKGLGKPQVLGEDAEELWVWAVKLEDYGASGIGMSSRERGGRCIWFGSRPHRAMG